MVGVETYNSSPGKKVLKDLPYFLGHVNRKRNFYFKSTQKFIPARNLSAKKTLAKSIAGTITSKLISMHNSSLCRNANFGSI